ncbi:LysE family translocator [Chondromyces crocatus]|uniref:Lysine transporter LysE n=1 Tax=Chondromyces crocatus TaxID=52 RepID=A0A0K1EHB3_CHOCO|nr:LysE family transporter [Chondromyces crocatus]AKT40255.1 uncharacterized protein CMC5_044080 [Chondromyces crocatus]
MNILTITLVAFAFGFIGSIPLTGPVAAMVLSACVQKQYGLAVRIGLGAAVAEAFYATAAFWGFSRFLADNPLVLSLSHGLSAVVLGVLGLYFMRWTPSETAQPGEEKHLRGFVLGFSVSILNPTLLATWSTAVAYLYSRQIVPFTELEAIPFGLAAAAGVAAWEVLLVALLRRYEARFPRRALAWLIRGMGLLLLVMAVTAGVDFVRAMQQR